MSEGTAGAHFHPCAGRPAPRRLTHAREGAGAGAGAGMKASLPQPVAYLCRLVSRTRESARGLPSGTKKQPRVGSSRVARGK